MSELILYCAAGLFVGVMVGLTGVGGGSLMTQLTDTLIALMLAAVSARMLFGHCS